MSSVHGVIMNHDAAKLDDLLRMGGRSSSDSPPLPPGDSSTVQTHKGPQVRGLMGWESGSQLGKWVLQWDGEIYNRTALLKRLHLSHDTDDRTLVLKGWDLDGRAFLNRINGPFALALWNLDEQTCRLARGIQGLRPVFWFKSPVGVAFAQDMPTLFQCPWVSREPNWERLAEYLVFDHIAGGETFYRRVNELLPGEILSYSASGGMTKHAHFQHSPLASPPSPRKQWVIDRTERMLGTAVRRLWSAGPETNVAIFLSGGVDSTLLTQTLHKLDGKIPCLTVTCPGFKHDESTFARTVCQSLGLPGIEIPLNPDAFTEGWRESIKRIRSPLTSTNQVAWWLLCEKAKSGGWQIVFAGEGADGWISGGLYEEELKRLHRFWREDPDEVASQIICCRTHMLNDPVLIEQILTVPLDLEGRRRIWEEVRQDDADHPIEDLALRYHVQTNGHRLLTRAELAAACHGIHLRLPYLEDYWVRWSLSLPLSLRNAGEVRKWPLKALCARRWGEPFAYRKKIGFPFPLRTWIQSGRNRTLKTWGYMLTDKIARGRGLYRAEVLEREIGSRLKGRRKPADWLLWSLINLELWLRDLDGLAAPQDGPSEEPCDD